MSYGFVKNLHFFGEDYGDIQILLFGAENQPFPYQGIKYLLYPLFLIFGNQPSGYFQTALFLYFLLALFLAFIIWKYTQDKTIAFISGLLFSVGYVGSESMFVVELAIPEIMFIFSMLAILFFYSKYITFRDTRSWVLSFLIYSLALGFVSQRSHTLLVFVFLADLCLTWNQKVTSLFKNIAGTLKRISPFILAFGVVYVGLPLLLHGTVKNYLGTYWVWATYDVLNTNSYLMYLSDLGNYLVPSDFQKLIALSLQKLNFSFAAPLIIVIFLLLPTFLFFLPKSLITKSKKYVYPYWIFLLINSYLIVSFSERSVSLLMGSTIGFFFLTLILAAYVFVKFNKKSSRLFIFCSLSWLTSTLLYHTHEANLVHSSTHRYLTSGFPFFVSIIAIIIAGVFNNHFSGKVLKAVGYGFVVLIFLSYSIAAYQSPVKQGYLTRSLHLRNFITSLKSYVPELGPERRLLYFDVTNDAEIISLFNSFLFTGSFTEETALRAIYGESPDKVKVVRDYETFLEEKGVENYSNTSAFFYDADKKLHYISEFSLSVMSHRSITLDDFSRLNLGLYFSNQPNTLLRNKTIFYKTRGGYFSEEFQNINEILEVGVENLSFPSYKPIRLDVVMTLDRLTTEIDNFKYLGPQQTDDDKDQGVSILAYSINDKFLFRSKATPSRTRAELDGEKHGYSFFLPPGGTKLRSILIEFPNIPISATIEKLTLTQVD